MNKEESTTLPTPQGTSHCSCLEHCFLLGCRGGPWIRWGGISSGDGLPPLNSLGTTSSEVGLPQGAAGMSVERGEPYLCC